MVNRPKQVGTAWETGIVNWLVSLRGRIASAYRKTLSGAADEGDIHFHDPKVPFIIEAKWQMKGYDFATAINELEVECKNSKKRWGWAVVHRKGKGSPKDAYWIMTGAMAAEVMRDLGLRNEEDTWTGEG